MCLTSGEGGALKRPYNKIKTTSYEASPLHDVNEPELISALYDKYNDRLHHYIKWLMDPDEDADKEELLVPSSFHLVDDRPVLSNIFYLLDSSCTTRFILFLTVDQGMLWRLSL